MSSTSWIQPTTFGKMSQLQCYVEIRTDTAPEPASIPASSPIIVNIIKAKRCEGGPPVNLRYFRGPPGARLRPANRFTAVLGARLGPACEFASFMREVEQASWCLHVDLLLFLNFAWGPPMNLRHFRTIMAPPSLAKQTRKQINIGKPTLCLLCAKHP